MAALFLQDEVSRLRVLADPQLFARWQSLQREHVALQGNLSRVQAAFEVESTKATLTVSRLASSHDDLALLSYLRAYEASDFQSLRSRVALEEKCARANAHVAEEEAFIAASLSRARVDALEATVYLAQLHALASKIAADERAAARRKEVEVTNNEHTAEMNGLRAEFARDKEDALRGLAYKHELAFSEAEKVHNLAIDGLRKELSEKALSLSVTRAECEAVGERVLEAEAQLQETRSALDKERAKAISAAENLAVAKAQAVKDSSSVARLQEELESARRALAEASNSASASSAASSAAAGELPSAPVAPARPKPAMRAKPSPRSFASPIAELPVDDGPPLPTDATSAEGGTAGLRPEAATKPARKPSKPRAPKQPKLALPTFSEDAALPDPDADGHAGSASAPSGKAARGRGGGAPAPGSRKRKGVVSASESGVSEEVGAPTSGSSDAGILGTGGAAGDGQASKPRKRLRKLGAAAAMDVLNVSTGSALDEGVGHTIASLAPASGAGGGFVLPKVLTMPNQPPPVASLSALASAASSAPLAAPPGFGASAGAGREISRAAGPLALASSSSGPGFAFTAAPSGNAKNGQDPSRGQGGTLAARLGGFKMPILKM